MSKAFPVDVYSRRQIAVASVTPVVSASPAYTANDTIGGKMTFTGLLSTPQFASRLKKVLIQCKTAQTAACDLVLFSSDPAGTTVTDNGPAAVAVADIPKIVANINIPTGAWAALGTPSVAEVDCDIPLPGNNGGSLFGILITRGTPTLGSTSDINVVLHAEKE